MAPSRGAPGAADGSTYRCCAMLTQSTTSPLWFVTKLDVLDYLDSIPVCTTYRHNGATLDWVPAIAEEYSELEPVYEELPGWNKPTSGITEFSELPRAAKDYIAFLEERLGRRDRRRLDWPEARGDDHPQRLGRWSALLPLELSLRLGLPAGQRRSLVDRGAGSNCLA